MNIIRLLAMCSIVWGHCLYGWEEKVFCRPDYQIIQAVIIQSGRIGTIWFFLISGFFLSDKLSGFNIVSFTRYRLLSLIVPWAIFLSLYILIEVVHLSPDKQILHGDIKPAIHMSFELFKAFIFHGAYWFIPASIITAYVLITLKKYINQPWLCITLICFTVFYSVNLYYRWITVDHTKAFWGYTLFLWMGIQVKRNIDQFKVALDKIPWTLLLTCLILMFTLSCWEGIKLTQIGCADAYSSLRCSNSILAIAGFLCLLKSDGFQWIHKLNSAKYVYGIYLVHSIIGTEISPFLNRYLAHYSLFDNLPYLIVIQCLYFSIVFASSYFLVAGITKSPLYFVVGRRR
ncbi:acyltransferase family protein [Mucilaginibacter paludis]|nr:acyltransferase [Mucilaginibacter paludis]